MSCIQILPAHNANTHTHNHLYSLSKLGPLFVFLHFSLQPIDFVPFLEWTKFLIYVSLYNMCIPMTRIGLKQLESNEFPSSWVFLINYAENIEVMLDTEARLIAPFGYTFRKLSNILWPELCGCIVIFHKYSKKTRSNANKSIYKSCQAICLHFQLIDFIRTYLLTIDFFPIKRIF